MLALSAVQCQFALVTYGLGSVDGVPAPPALWHDIRTPRVVPVAMGLQCSTEDRSCRSRQN